MTTRTQAAIAEKAKIFNLEMKDKDIQLPLVEKKSIFNKKLFKFSFPNQFKNLSMPLKHIVIGLVLRLILIVVGEFTDEYFHVSYTDVDYRVFTDAARYVSQRQSPYLRHTYRYSPIIAYFNLPNIYLHDTFGKILFSIIDMIVSFLIYKLALLFSTPKLATLSSLIWLYNPVSLIISTRGNSDSLICMFVLITLYYRLQNKVILSGIFLALSIHLRMYPLLFSLPLFLSLRNLKDRIKLVLSTVFILGLLTGTFYYLYGEKFINESYLYHLSREDIKHNYSVHFLSQYLNVSSPILKFIPLLILQVVIAVKFFNINDLPFCLFLQTFIFVTFSPVLTCQYFIWYISLFTPILPQFISINQIITRFIIWILILLLWLVPAYYLEYHALNLFVYVGIMSALFFIVNVNFVVKLVELYKPMKKIE